MCVWWWHALWLCVAPDFVAETSVGRIRWHEYISGRWAVLFSHPADFTPVCTTELGRVASLSDEWKKRNTVVMGLSVDSLESHSRWIPDINAVNQVSMAYPLVADADRKISVLYGMVDATTAASGMPLTVRSVYVVDALKTIRLILTYPASTGRNFAEILRCIDSLQLTSYKKVATPVDWVKGGQTVVLPSIPTEEARKLFPKGVQEVRSYLRFTPDPSDANIPADLTGAPAGLQCGMMAPPPAAAAGGGGGGAAPQQPATATTTATAAPAPAPVKADDRPLPAQVHRSDANVHSSAAGIGIDLDSLSHYHPEANIKTKSDGLGVDINELGANGVVVSVKPSYHSADANVRSHQDSIGFEI